MPTHKRKNPADPNLALRLELAMRRRGIKATELARVLGCTPGAVSHWINQRYEPQRQLIPKIAEALNVSVDWLMGHQLTDEQRELERRYLEYIQVGGDELLELLQHVPPNELLAHLRKLRDSLESD